MKNLSKKIISLMLAVVMAMPAIMAMPFAAEAEDVPSSAYWSILASTDFTSTTWSGSGDSYSTSSSPRTAKGGNAIGWNVKYGTHSTDSVIVNSKGVNFNWVDDNNKYQGLMYMSSYNGQTSNTIFNGIDNFKIDLAFSFTGKAKCSTGYDLNSANAKDKDVPLIKLANDSSNKYNHNSKYITQNNYFTQTMWGERTVSSTSYFVDGGKTETDGTTTGGKWAITTSDNNEYAVLAANITYHYVVYVADNMLGCYVTDDSGNLLINYNPIEIASFNLAPSVISSIYLGASEFNFWGKYDVENIAYKSIEIYKGVDTSTYDSSRDKFLYAYFTGNDAAGETMHYAISQDGINFETVSGGTKVWNPSTNPATETYPATDSAPYSDSVAISNHVRDSYAFIGQDGKDYVIATDLNTNNGDWGNIQNSRFLVWKMDYFGDINDTRPWTIDTANLPGMDDITGGTSGTHKTVKKAWAPQVIYDPDMGKYMLYWSVGADGISTQVYYTYTSDFKTDFTTVKRLLYPDFAGSGITNHIDADITYHNGLYYCYFKNEDGSGTGSKRIWYAVAPNANGPYTDYELINTSYGAEGPQVYETGNGSYMLMVDGYGDGTYHMYSAGSPYSFNTSNETATNVTSLSPRHGSIIRITDAEYQKLKKLRIGEELRYAWETTGDYGHNSTQTDSTGNQYHVTWNPNPSTTTTGSGLLTLTDSGMYTDLSTVTNFIASDVYTVTFYYKSNGSTVRDDDHSIFSISRDNSWGGNSVFNYLRLSTNGKFLVNNAVVTPSGNCSDGTTTRASKFASAVADTTNSHRYTVTSDGFITSLIIDGEYICGVINGTDIPNTLWITFGWARIANYENNRLTAQFGQIVFKNVATETGTDEELFSDYCTTSDVSSSKIKSFNYTVTLCEYGHEAVNGYSNVIYSNGYIFSDQINKTKIKFKTVLPQNIVIAYDGARSASVPMVFENVRDGSNSQRIKTLFPTDSRLEFKDYWWGWITDYKEWPGGSKSSSSYNDYIGYAAGIDHETDKQDNSSSRFWWNRLYYKGNMTSGNNTIYSDDISGFGMDIYSKNNSNGYSDNYFNTSSSSHIYVVNYKPIYDILKDSSPTTINVDGAKDIRALRNYLISGDGVWKYTTESKEAALERILAVGRVDPNTFDYSTPSTGVSNAANAIKTAYENYLDIPNILVKKTFNVTYRMADGTTKAEIVTAGSNLANVPSTTSAFHITDTNTHKKNCSWTGVSADPVPAGSPAYNPSVTPSTSVMPKANTIYTETAATTETCEIAHVAAAGDVNGYNRYECSICGETNDDYRMWDSQTWTTYNTNYGEYEGIVGDASYATTYTTTSKNTYETTVGNNTLNTEDQSISQSRINTNAGNILFAKSGLDEVADITYLETTYEKADTFLRSLIGKAAQYDATSLNKLITAVNAAGSSEYVGATPAEKADFGTKGDISTSDQLKANALANAIKTANDGLTSTIAISDPGTDEEDKDITALDAAIVKINSLDPDAYDINSASVSAAYSGANACISNATVSYAGENNISVLNPSVTQEQVNDAVTDILTAISVSTKKYAVTKDAEGSQDFTLGIKNGTLDANNKAYYGATISAVSNSVDTVWYLDIVTDSMHKKSAYAGYGKSFTAKVLGTTKVKAIKKTASQSTVKIVRQYGTTAISSRSPVQLVEFVTTGSEYSIPDAAVLSYYTFAGYYSEEGAAINSPVTISGDTTIVARYNANEQSQCTIGASIASETGEPTDVTPAGTIRYNDKVELEGGANTYAWLEATDSTGLHYRPFYIGKDVEFLATESTTLKAVNETDFAEFNFTLPAINLRKSGVMTTTVTIEGVEKTRTTFNAQIVPGNAEIREYGILIGAPYGATPVSEVAASKVIIENSGKHTSEGYQVLRAKSTKLVGANQFVISVNGIPSGYVYRGYIVYADAQGNLHNVYSEAMTE